MQQWQVYLVVYTNSGDTPYTKMSLDLNLTETQYAILTGTTYTIVSAIAGIGMGFFADKVNRKRALFVFSMIWSSLTLTQSFASGFYTIMVPRFFLEIALSATFPLCFSLISDSFAPRY
jgi:MFS family permease